MANQRDEERETRITNEIIVDAYNEEEQALGWYYYLEERLHIPFRAKCIEERTISPLRKDEIVTVKSIASEDDCKSEIFVLIDWQGRTLGIPLDQLVGIDVDKETAEAIADWHYWVEQGHQW